MGEMVVVEKEKLEALGFTVDLRSHDWSLHAKAVEKEAR